MIRISIIDHDGKTVLPEDIAAPVDLAAVAEQARGLIRDCERLARNKDPRIIAARQGKVPYSS